MRKFLIPLSLLAALSCSLSPAQADDSEWITEEKMQKMSLAELQEWAHKTDKKVKNTRTFSTAGKPAKSRTHMEHRLGYSPMLAENPPELREELSVDSSTRPDGAKSSAFPEPKYYDEAMQESKGAFGSVLKVVGSPLTGTGHVLHFFGKGFDKILYFIDENFPWI